MNIIVPLVKLREIVTICDDTPEAVRSTGGNVVVNVTRAEQQAVALDTIIGKAWEAIRALEAGT